MAVQQVRAGLEAVYLSGWLDVANADTAGQMCPDQSLSMMEAGAAGVHFADQLASEEKCGHMGGKVLIRTAASPRAHAARRAAGGLSAG